LATTSKSLSRSLRTLVVAPRESEMLQDTGARLHSRSVSVVLRCSA
jgi:hypothetical protein